MLVYLFAGFILTVSVSIILVFFFGVELELIINVLMMGGIGALVIGLILRGRQAKRREAKMAQQQERIDRLKGTH